VLPVLCLSYPWLDPEHPDKDGLQLRSFVPIFRVLLRTARHYHSHGTIGVMWDYMSLPQKPYSNHVEEMIFKQGLKNLNLLYQHPYTIVLLVNSELPTLQCATPRPYDQRGWPFFEHHISSLVKYKNNLWAMCFFDARSESAQSIGGCAEMMRAHRLPPISPSRFGEELRAGVQAGRLAFTNNSDLELVIKLYGQGFLSAFNSFKLAIPESTRLGAHSSLYTLHYWDLDWNDEQGLKLVDALRYANQHCICHGLTVHCFKGNNFTTETQRLLMECTDPVKFTIEPHTKVSFSKRENQLRNMRKHDFGAGLDTKYVGFSK